MPERRMGVKTANCAGLGPLFGVSTVRGLVCNGRMSLPPKPAAAPVPADRGPAVAMRSFGRYALRALIGKSERSMVWLAHDPRSGQDVMLTLPRGQPADAQALEAWQREVGMAARLQHPHLAPPSEIGVQDHWPYIAVDRAYGMTIGEWLGNRGAGSTLEHVQMVCQALEGLAFAHDAGVAHGDLQMHSLLVSDQGTVRVMGLATSGGASAPATEPDKPHAVAAQQGHQQADGFDLSTRRARAETDVLAVGLLLYRLLSGQDPLEETDLTRVIRRMTPVGREIVRMPWATQRPVPEALRAIVNRATASQERQRYLNARTLLRALSGWHEVEGQDNGGPLALLLDRLRSVGHLPAMAGIGRRVARVVAAENCRTDELASELLQDMALSLELLRQVNSALLQGAHSADGAAVITVRRAVALLGVEGVRRAANALRTWPGPLSEDSAARLQRVIDRVRMAAHTAQALRPAGYDAEVIYLVVMLQNLGRLLISYHFPDEADQIVQLMRAAPPPPGSEPGTPEQPGLSESAASLAVLGVDIDAVGSAVARHWGLGDEVVALMRRLPKDKPVRTADSDIEILRTVASAANEVVDAVHLIDPKRLGASIIAIAQRYARALNTDAKGVRDALQAGRQGLRGSGLGAPARPQEASPAEPPDHPAAVARVTSLTPALVTTVGAASFPT